MRALVTGGARGIGFAIASALAREGVHLAIADIDPDPAALAARQWRQLHERAIIDEFVSLLAIPNIASDRANIQRNAEAIAALLKKRGVAARLVSVPEV